ASVPSVADLGDVGLRGCGLGQEDRRGVGLTALEDYGSCERHGKRSRGETCNKLSHGDVLAEAHSPFTTTIQQSLLFRISILCGAGGCDVTQWQLAHGRQIELGARALLMGIMNVTPDSFSDGGECSGCDRAVEHARRMAAEGADIIDVGGESTRPGATPVSAHEEQARILPVIEALAGDGNFVISVDTYRAETARLAVAAGAHIVNDVHGLQREPDVARLAAETGAGLVIMHTGRDRQRLPDVVADEFVFLRRS